MLPVEIDSVNRRSKRESPAMLLDLDSNNWVGFELPTQKSGSDGGCSLNCIFFGHLSRFILTFRFQLYIHKKTYVF